MPIRTHAHPSEILEAVASRLRLKISIYNDQNCFVSDQPVPDYFPGGRECCTVSPGGGNFPAAMFGGAGLATMTEDMAVTITTFIRHVRDRPAHRDQRLSAATDGLLVRRGQVIGALFAEHFDPVSADGSRYLLRDQLTPMGTSSPGPATIGETELIGAGLTIHTPFDWLVEDPAGEAAALAEPGGRDEYGRILDGEAQV